VGDRQLALLQTRYTDEIGVVSGGKFTVLPASPADDWSSAPAF
jgi:hypothetical protein